MAGKTVGYIRVSSFDQNPDRQLEGIKLDKRFIDKASGKEYQSPCSRGTNRLCTRR
jgi:DNA invertase Pin-like site-specific DNA recombinase